jgi:hypothetical protein
MSAWLDPVRRALDAVPSATFFFRDDDVVIVSSPLFGRPISVRTPPMVQLSLSYRF